MPPIPQPASAPKRSRRNELGRALSNAQLPQRSKGWRKISALDRAWLVEFEKLGFTKPEEAAAKAGFKTPGQGYKLELRLRDLVDSQRVRARLVAQMELDEALMLTAEGARDTGDRKTQATFLTLILRVHGALSEKPLPPADRRTLAKQVAEIVEKVRSRAGTGTGSSIRLRAAMQTVETKEAVEVELDLDPDPDPDLTAPSS